MPDTELNRAILLNQHMRKASLTPDSFLEPGYSAVVLHSTGTLFAGNQALTEITGYSAEEIIGMNAWRLFPTSSIPIVKQKLAEQSEAPYQVVIQHKNGAQFLVELKGRNIELAHEHVRTIQVRLIE